MSVGYFAYCRSCVVDWLRCTSSSFPNDFKLSEVHDFPSCRTSSIYHRRADVKAIGGWIIPASPMLLVPRVSTLFLTIQVWLGQCLSVYTCLGPCTRRSHERFLKLEILTCVQLIMKVKSPGTFPTGLVLWDGCTGPPFVWITTRLERRARLLAFLFQRHLSISFVWPSEVSLSFLIVLLLTHLSGRLRRLWRPAVSVSLGWCPG